MTVKIICEECGGNYIVKKCRLSDGDKYLCYNCAVERQRQKERENNRKRSGAYKSVTELKKQHGSLCQICGKVGKVYGHHVAHVKNGGKNTPDNLILLCHECHKKQHSGGTRR